MELPKLEKNFVLVEIILKGQTNWRKAIYYRNGGTLENIREKLKKYTLEDFSFISENPTWTTKESKEKYKDCASICGNFKEYSNAFSIITDDKRLLEEFKKLFEENRK